MTVFVTFAVFWFQAKEIRLCVAMLGMHGQTEEAFRLARIKSDCGLRQSFSAQVSGFPARGAINIRAPVLLLVGFCLEE